ncbi:helix-turn-helix domain-containing protein [Sphingomonas arantia]|uniref:Helix-turn-helix domain-containing protein n=1 Tax=Sphingomonas arantia TaxID=1460676 RepID=A0ABW4U0H2_9SPHN
MDQELARLNHAPDLSNRQLGWGGIVADVHWWRGPGEAMSLSPNHDVVAMRIAGSTPLTQRRNGKVDERVAAYGNVTVHPHGMDSHWSWTKPGAIMLMRVPPSLIGEVHRRSGGEQDLPNQFGFRDRMVEHYVDLFNLELHSPDDLTKGLRWEALSLALAAYLVEHVAGRDVQAPPQGGLSPATLRRVIEHIGDRWQDQHSLASLAVVAGVSRFHFARMFKLSTGRTPMEFIERSKLDHARQLIINGHHSLAQVGLLCGFVDQSHFARRFRLAFGLTPGAFAGSYNRL